MGLTSSSRNNCESVTIKTETCSNIEEDEDSGIQELSDDVFYSLDE